MVESGMVAVWLHKFASQNKCPRRYVRKLDFLFQEHFASGNGGFLRPSGHYSLHLCKGKC